MRDFFPFDECDCSDLVIFDEQLSHMDFVDHYIISIAFDHVVVFIAKDVAQPKYICRIKWAAVNLWSCAVSVY